LVALQVFGCVNVPGLAGAGLLAGALLAGRLGHVLILCLLVLVLLTGGLLFLGLSYGASENAEGEKQEAGQTAAHGARKDPVGRRAVDGSWGV
jgi:hypothetical protein